MSIKSGSKVSYSYHSDRVVTGEGTVLHDLIIGSEEGYAIQPQDGSEVIHVRAFSVREVL